VIFDAKNVPFSSNMGALPSAASRFLQYCSCQGTGLRVVSAVTSQALAVSLSEVWDATTDTKSVERRTRLGHRRVRSHAGGDSGHCGWHNSANRFQCEYCFLPSSQFHRLSSALGAARIFWT